MRFTRHNSGDGRRASFPICCVKGEPRIFDICFAVWILTILLSHRKKSSIGIYRGAKPTWTRYAKPTHTASTPQSNNLAVDERGIRRKDFALSRCPAARKGEVFTPDTSF